jgi:hypothetical protein
MTDNLFDIDPLGNEDEDDAPEVDQDPEAYRQKILETLDTPLGYESLLNLAEEAPESLMQAAYYVDRLKSKAKIKAIYTKAAETNPVMVYNQITQIGDLALRKEIQALALKLMSHDE